jgi:hypothetical protein
MALRSQRRRRRRPRRASKTRRGPPAGATAAAAAIAAAVAAAAADYDAGVPPDSLGPDTDQQRTGATRTLRRPRFQPPMCRPGSSQALSPFAWPAGGPSYGRPPRRSGEGAAAADSAQSRDAAGAVAAGAAGCWLIIIMQRSGSTGVLSGLVSRSWPG